MLPAMAGVTDDRQRREVSECKCGRHIVSLGLLQVIVICVGCCTFWVFTVTHVIVSGYGLVCVNKELNETEIQRK